MTDYKKYALGQVENFLYDAMSTNATAQEIYDVIKAVVEDNYVVYTKSADQARELLNLLNGHRPVNLDLCDKDDTSEECVKSWNDFWQYTDKEIEEMCDAAELEQDLKNVDEFLKKDKSASDQLPPQQKYLGWQDVNRDEFDKIFPQKKDKVKSWVIPVDDDYNITFPEDLLEQTGWKEGDVLQWIDQGEGSFKMIKVTKPLRMDEC